ELVDAFLTVDTACINCGICEKVCPLGALEVVKE
ncbi:MAG: 4Fe-4S binding protein, partial [Methanocalculus sp.]